MDKNGKAVPGFEDGGEGGGRRRRSGLEKSGRGGLVCGSADGREVCVMAGYIEVTVIVKRFMREL